MGQHAEAVVLAACALADAAAPGRWSAGAAEDAVAALEVLADALSQRDPESAEILAVIPAAVAALRERTEQLQAAVPGAEDEGGGPVRGAGGVSTVLRRALAAHRIGGRVYQLGAALITVTLEAADAQALAVLLTPAAASGTRAAAREAGDAEWGNGLAGTAAAALGEVLTAYGPGGYARVLDSGQVTIGMSPQAAQQAAAALAARTTGGRPRRRGLGHGWKGIDTPAGA
ncbi:hypothetical protein ABZ769_27985 [Streptomyces olivoreticuli]